MAGSRSRQGPLARGKATIGMAPKAAIGSPDKTSLGRSGDRAEGAQTTAEGDGLPDSIELEPFYYDLKNQLVRPKQVVVGTRYFWEKWAPLLGPTLTVLVVRLRMHCYYNQQTKERRDWCYPTQQTLAEEIGISRWTVMRELKKPLAQRFVRVQYRSQYDAARRQTVRVSSLYHVAMDDPLVDEDHEKVSALAAGHRRAAAAASGEEAIRNIAGLAAAVPADGGKSPRQVADPSFSPAASQAQAGATAHDLQGPKPASAKPASAKRALAPGARKRTSGVREHSAVGPSGSNLPPKETRRTNTSDDVAAVARELISERVSPRVAQQLAEEYPADLIREKVALVRRITEERGELRNVPGFLRRAIEDDYQTPLAATGTESSGGLLTPLPSPARRARLESALHAIGPALTSPELLSAGASGRAFTATGRSGWTSSTTVAEDVWQQVKEKLRQAIAPAAFAQWLDPSRLLHYEGQRVIVGVSDAYVQRYLERRLSGCIDAALHEVCGPGTAFEVRVEPAGE